MMVDLKLHEFDKDEPNVDEPFQPLVGHFMWLVNPTQLEIINAVRAVVRCSAAPMLLHWQEALHNVTYTKSTSTHGIALLRDPSS